VIGTLLIANRGEIARRIIRTARRMGVTTVAVYSDADAEAPFAQEADAAVRIGPPPPAESYLKIDAILEAAETAGAEAVHPGYGFLSENAEFAEACARAGLIFVGPPPEAIRAMGLKDRAKTLMAAAGVPVTPGYHGADQSERTLKAAADEIGYPVLVKAVAGGGGKGMRAARSSAELGDALASARREAKTAFGDDRVLIEKLIAAPRHVEVQVFGDSHGNVIHLFERDCSLQRRHQKVIEEAPAPGMTEKTRAAMCAAAVAAAKAVGYVNAGTVEFIVDGRKGLRPDGFWFMEMNTRLQVEHPVTEMITGLDLVELQLEVAAGGRLPAQDEIALKGHAIEARLYAEDPATGFLPSIGALAIFDLSGFAVSHEGVTLRLDSGVEEGDAVRPYYDPMLAKAIAHAPTRDAAADALAGALGAARIWPVRANAGFLARALAHPDFRAAKLDTGFIDARLDALATPTDPADAAVLGALVEAVEADAGAWSSLDPWGSADGWRLNASARRAAAFDIAGARHDVAVERAADGFALHVGGGTRTARIAAVNADRGEGALALSLDGRPRAAAWMRLPDALLLFVGGEAFELRPPTHGAGGSALEAGDQILAPMPGKVLEVRAKPGDALAAGDKVLVLEAMKMEHALAAPRSGVLQSVAVKAGDQVAHGDVLARLEPLGPAEADGGGA
jgi:acetyl/propionyl-CoA carboxylase alpha subunit